MTPPLEGQLTALAAELPEIQVNLSAEIDHILSHVKIDEPSGTWKGGACARHGRPLGSDVDLADLGDLSRAGTGLTDVTWYAPDILAEVYRMTVRVLADGTAASPDWWEHRRRVVWSYAWNACYTFLAEVVEEPARRRGSDGLLIASFEHNSSGHGLARPHVHNLVGRRADGPGEAERALAPPYGRYADQLAEIEALRGGCR